MLIRLFDSVLIMRYVENITGRIHGEIELSTPLKEIQKGPEEIQKDPEEIRKGPEEIWKGPEKLLTRVYILLHSI